MDHSDFTVYIQPDDAPISFEERRDRDQREIPINLNDVQLVAGGTAVMPGSGAVLSGELPAPWNPSVAEADRRVGADQVAEAIRRVLERED